MLRATELAALAAFLIIRTGAASDLELDHCRFKGEDGRGFLELYIELPRAAVAHQADSTGWFGSVEFTVEITRNSLSLMHDNWRIDDITATAEEISSGQDIVDARLYNLPPGGYEISVIAVDSVSGKRWTGSLRVDIASFPTGELCLSDIELAGYILPGGVLSRFDRGGFSLVPNPGRMFGRRRPFFIYYIEIYPPAGSDAPADYTIERTIVNGVGKVVVNLPAVTCIGGPQSFADIDSVTFEELPTGSYTFSIHVTDEAGNSARQEARFFIYRPDLASRPVTPTLDSLAIDTELREIEFLLTRDQIDRSGSMSTTEKYHFLEAFWRRYDDDPSTPEVPLRYRFRERVAEADQRWQTSRQPGHQTDRGRIHVLYGEPNNRENHPHDTGAKPYEIWTYDRLEGGVTFVFVDRGGIGEYVLVHSNKRGEIHRPDWYEEYAGSSE